MTTIRLHEAGQAQVPLRPEDALWLQGLDVATCSPCRLPGHFDVRVKNVAGLISNGRITVEITPKMPVGEFMWLLTYAATGIKLSADEVRAAPTDVSAALAAVLVKLVSDGVSGGLPRGYWEDEHTSPTLRGRLRLTDQLTRHLGRLYPLELSVSEFGVDIPENQIMRAACVKALATLVAGAHRPTATVQSDLRRLIRQFDGVTPLTPGAPPPAWRRTPQNARAWPAIDLSELVLHGHALDVVHGDRTSTGLIIKTWRVFEEAVARGLREARPDWSVLSQTSYSLIAGTRSLQMRPDLVITRSGEVTAVADTKYRTAATSSDEVFQMFTYAKYLGLDRAHLIYADEHGTSQAMRVRHTEVDIVSHRVGLRAPSATLIAQLRAVAMSM